MTVADDLIARPTYKPDKRVELDEDAVLTRYLTHAKFADMVRTESIYLARLARLREMDCDEGRIATSHYLADVKFRERDGTNAPSQRELYRRFLELGPHQQAFVSCWYMGEAEDERMWREYLRRRGRGGSDHGTTVDRTIQR